MCVCVCVADIRTLHWEMKRRLSLYQWGVLIRPKRHHIRLYGVFHSLTPGVSGQVALAALVALIALVIYHLTIHTRDPQHSSPLESSSQILYCTETVRPDWHPGYGTTCSGYKHLTLRDEKTSIPLSVRDAYKATTAPYQTTWCFRFGGGGTLEKQGDQPTVPPI